LRGDVVATLGYVANWRFVLAHQGYFAQFSTPSPLRHTWSLAIEEQYYLLWPLLLLALVRLGRGSARRVLGALGGGGVACAGAVVVASVARPDAGPLGRLLSLKPLRWVGRLSYGMYLWHWPVIDLLTHQKTGLSGSALQLFQAGVTVAAATASYYVIERPVRA